MAGQDPRRADESDRAGPALASGPRSRPNADAVREHGDAFACVGDAVRKRAYGQPADCVGRRADGRDIAVRRDGLGCRGNAVFGRAHSIRRHGDGVGRGTHGRDIPTGCHTIGCRTDSGNVAARPYRVGRYGDAFGLRADAFRVRTNALAVRGYAIDQLDDAPNFAGRRNAVSVHSDTVRGRAHCGNVRRAADGIRRGADRRDVAA